MSDPTEAERGAAELLHPSIVHHVANTLGWPALRPLQEAAIEPLMGGSDALLLAPTAGGKTEAAAFPLLSRMAADRWAAPSLLYLAPLKALLNNLAPRLESYAGWVGRRAGLWHGDVTAGVRRELLADPPDVLLTTPESLEAMLVSTKVDHRELFAGLRAVVIDEVHAFAGDDRGWHLLAVLERLSRVAARPLQRVGLSATVGNPDELLTWLQGSGGRPGQVVAPSTDSPGGSTGRPGEGLSGGGSESFETGSGVGVRVPPGEVQLDHVASVENAARVIAALHGGEKRLVFCESRRLVEQLGSALRMRGVTTFLSHAALSLDERRRAEQAFAESRDCVIVSTSTLELGIDVGDLDRVIQVNAPLTVASFLQRIGRTGRRPGAVRNCLFLALDETGLLDAAGLLLAWGRGFVESVTPPPAPRHIAAQQILALCLQENRVGTKLFAEWWGGLEPFSEAAVTPLVSHLVTSGFLESDGGMLFIGPAAEREFGRRHFMDLTSAFTAPPEFTVVHGREEIGRTDPALLTSRVDGPRLLLLAGHSWRVTWIDWKRHRCFVESADGGGLARWTSTAFMGGTFALSRAIREVLLGADPPVRLTRRATLALEAARSSLASTVHPRASVIVRDTDGEVRWWTWAGYRANATLQASLQGVVDDSRRPAEFALRLRPDLTPEIWKAGLSEVRLFLPAVDGKALEGLKFSTALPRHLAEATLAARLGDLHGAQFVLDQPVSFTSRP